VSAVTTVVAVFIALLGAYGFTRLHFPGRKFFLTLIIYSQMFCLAAIIIPIYRILAGLQLIDSYPGLVIAFLTFSVPIAIWLLRSFLHNIPPQLEEAALHRGGLEVPGLLEGGRAPAAAGHRRHRGVRVLSDVAGLSLSLW
jgi:ABC-type glycerol-3-phosphate transport system permease component